MRFFLIPFISLTIFWCVDFLFEPNETVVWLMLGLMLSTVYCMGDAYGRAVEHKRCSDIVQFHANKIQTIIGEQLSKNQTT